MLCRFWTSQNDNSPTFCELLVIKILQNHLWTTKEIYG
jgi:hypothetical protein